MHLCLANVVKRLFLLFGFIHLWSVFFFNKNSLGNKNEMYDLCYFFLNLVKDYHCLSQF